MSSPLEVVAASYIFIHYTLKTKRKRKSPRWWVSQMYKNRDVYSGSSLLADLKFQSVSGLYKNFTRMHPIDFEFLLSLITPKICKQDTNFRKGIPAQERLALTLRFLATGDSYTSLQYLFKISKQSISKIVPEVCDAIMEVLKDYIQIPQTQEDWLKVAEDFDRTWNFPHCIGAIDGKHVTLQCPINSGSEYINYKGFFSIVLLALVDANYNFLFVDVGCQGRISDGGVFANTRLHKLLNENNLNIPQPIPLHGREKEVPFFFVGDEAFAMTENLMKVYGGYHSKGSIQRLFNYRLCRARRVVENVFGIVSSTFRVLRKPLLIEPQKASCIVLTIALLHNFLRRRSSSSELYTPQGTFDCEETGVMTGGNWRQINNTEVGSLLSLTRIARRSQSRLLATRDELADYFTKEGKVEWQDNYA